MRVTDLVDIPYGNLRRPERLRHAPGRSRREPPYTCTFTGTFTGDPGDTQTDLVRVGGIVDGKPYVGFASATVRITDILPALTVTKTATPNPIDEPGGPVPYEIEVTNTSAEAAFLTTLFDDVYGDLNGKGDCEADPTVVVKPARHLHLQRSSRPSPATPVRSRPTSSWPSSPTTMATTPSASLARTSSSPT